mgnify:CR=1 FL=1
MNAGARSRLAIAWPTSARGSSPSCAAAASLHHSMRLSRVEHHHAVGQRLRGAAKARQRVLEQALAAHAGALVLVQRVQHFVPGAAAFGDPAGDRGGEPARQAGEVPDVVHDQREQRDGEDRPARRGPTASATTSPARAAAATTASVRP